jgi:anti-sigma regulatory factor (Ser/Thr protein kinase)
VNDLATRAEPFLLGAGAPLEIARAARLALEEIGTNLVKYAWADPRGREIRVALRAEAARVVLVVEDDGRPFDPRGAPGPALDLPVEKRRIGGLGLHLVRAMASGLDYRSENGWNRLTVRFDRPAAPPDGRAPLPPNQETNPC